MICQFRMCIYCLHCFFFNYKLCVCSMNACEFVCFGNFIFCLICMLSLLLKIYATRSSHDLQLALTLKHRCFSHSVYAFIRLYVSSVHHKMGGPKYYCRLIPSQRDVYEICFVHPSVSVCTHKTPPNKLNGFSCSLTLGSLIVD